MPHRKKHNTKNLYFSDRLLNKLGEIPEYPVTVIEAPMGYGKTTAVKEFLGNLNHKGDYVWQSVYDNSVISFWQDFISLFKSVSSEVYVLLKEYGNPEKELPLQQVIRILQDIELENNLYIIIDDFHHIDHPILLELMEKLSERQIEKLHIILTGRFTRLHKLEELKLKQCIHYIDKNSFELARDEIKNYYKKCSITLNQEQLNMLYEATEGWISALYLFMIEYVKEGEFQSVASVYILLEKTIYQSLEKAMKDFLMMMSVFDSFTLKQAEFMWSIGNGKEMISKLMDNNLFVSYNSKNKTYHIHSIFLDYLRTFSKDALGLEIEVLYAKGARWFEENEDYKNAKKYYFMSEDFDSLLGIIEKDISNDYSLENKKLLDKYFNACPESVKSRHHFALLIYALHLFLHKDIELFKQTCQDITENIHRDDKLKQIERNRILGELELLLSFSEYNNITKMIARQKRAWELLGQPSKLFNKNSNWTFGVPSALSLYYSKSGDLEEHINEMKEGLHYYFKLTGGHGAGAEHVIDAEYKFNQGDFINAEIAIEKGLMTSKVEKEENIYYSARYIKLLISFMQGKFEEIIKFLNELHKDVLTKEDYHRIHVVEICEGCIYAYLDQMDKVPKRLQKIELDKLHLLFPAYPFFNIMYGRMLLNNKEYSKLIGISQYFLSISSIFNNVLGYVYTYIYLAGAYRKLFKDEEAVEVIKKALDLAIPDKQYMLFVENCDYIKPILESVSHEEKYREAINKIFTLSSQYEENKQILNSKFYNENEFNLTKREKEIAALAAKGYSNNEIAEQLFISVNTVKKILRSIYIKLSVSSRTQLQVKLGELT